jgi:hypothetical protein
MHVCRAGRNVSRGHKKTKKNTRPAKDNGLVQEEAMVTQESAIDGHAGQHSQRDDGERDSNPGPNRESDSP